MMKTMNDHQWDAINKFETATALWTIMCAIVMCGVSSSHEARCDMYDIDLIL
jgi:hypothetical protein